MPREWFSSGFFDADMSELLFDPAKLREAKREVADIARLAGLKKGAAVLDAACGEGRHSLEFAARGFRVTGVDITEAYVRQAARLAKKRALKNAGFEKGELRDLYRFQGAFDLVLNLFTSFGYYQRATDNQESLWQMASALKRGGVLVMEVMPRETLDGIFTERHWQATRGGFLLQRRRWVDGGRKLRNDLIWIGKGKEREAMSEIFVYTQDELKAMFRRAGLKDIKTYRNYKGQPFKMGHRLVITGVK
jgi:SAM-dependent methyltransferase